MTEKSRTICVGCRAAYDGRPPCICEWYTQHETHQTTVPAGVRGLQSGGDTVSCRIDEIRARCEKLRHARAFCPICGPLPSGRDWDGSCPSCGATAAGDAVIALMNDALDLLSEVDRLSAAEAEKEEP